MYILMALIIVSMLVIFNLPFLKKFKARKVSLTTTLRTTTQLDIEYTLFNESGVINIAKVGDCFTPVLRPTLQGWRVEVPLDYSAKKIADYIKGIPDQSHIKRMHQEGINFLVFIFGGRLENPALSDLDERDKDMLFEGIANLKSHVINLSKRLPDVNVCF